MECSAAVKKNEVDLCFVMGRFLEFIYKKAVL